MEYNLLEAVEDSFSIYAAMTIQNRAIVDVRDCIKPSVRQCMYAQLIDKITYKHPFKKSNKSVAAALDHFYVHGDTSCYALLTRLAKDFCMRYPLEDFDGSYGTITSGTSEAASRYTEMRLGELGVNLFNNIDKDCIDVWYDNYDNTEQFPSVAPTLGYYNICNGAMGIATSLSTSIPQYNLKEVNEALIKLLYNPNVDFDEIYCPPDFCTGATILNGNEVKESHKVGHGRAAIIRSTVTYDEKENCLYCTEIPYGVYTETIVGQIAAAINDGHLIGIKNVLDLSTKKANIKIILEKNVNVQKLVKQLYKLTSLQDSYTINLVMLDNGTTPKVFGWKEALQAHLDHEAIVYTKIHEFEIKKIDARLNIIDGLLIAIANIDEVVSLIKSSQNKAEAKEKLISRFGFNELQVDSILKMTLSKLINLEITSLKDEKEKLISERENHTNILNNKQLLKDEIANGLREVIKKFGDNRRTVITNLDYKNSEEDAEPIEKKELLIYLTNLGNIYTQESTTLMKTKRGGKGSKIKMGTKEYVVKTIKDDNFSTICAFSNTGTMYSYPISELPVNDKINTKVLFELSGNETINTIVSFDKHNVNEYITFVTKNGFVKKTAFKEYRLRKGKSLKAINLDNDEVVSVFVGNDTRLAILTEKGLTINIDISEITATGRTTKGVIGIKLNKNDSVIDAKMIDKDCKYIVTLSKSGLIKKADITDFPICSRATKGKRISDVIEDDDIVGFLTLNEDSDIIITTKKKVIKFSTNELRVLSRAAVGVKAITIDDGDNAITLAKED